MEWLKRLFRPPTYHPSAVHKWQITGHTTGDALALQDVTITCLDCGIEMTGPGAGYMKMAFVSGFTAGTRAAQAPMRRAHTQTVRDS